MLNLRGNNFEHLPRSIAQLGALQYLDLLDCKKLTQLPEDIGSLSSLKTLNLSGNNFEHLPHSIPQLGALEYLDLSDGKKLTQLPEFPQQLHGIDANWNNDLFCNLLFQNISSLQLAICSSHSLSLRVFWSWGEFIPSWFKYQGMGTSVSVNLPKNWYVSYNFLRFAVCYSGKPIDYITAHLIPFCDDGMSSMTQEFALSNNSHEKYENAWSNDWICNSLFQNISSLQHDICASDSLSLRVFKSWLKNIPSWFHHQGMSSRVSVNLLENWYVSDKFLGFVVCYSGKSIDYITAHLIPLRDDGMSLMTRKFALSCHSPHFIKFLLVPLGGLWDASNANRKTPNDYGCIKLDFIGETDGDFGKEKKIENMKCGAWSDFSTVTTVRN